MIGVSRQFNFTVLSAGVHCVNCEHYGPIVSHNHLETDQGLRMDVPWRFVVRVVSRMV